MPWRIIAFAVLLGIILTFPIHGAFSESDPCYKFTEGLNHLKAEHIYYRGYYIIPDNGVEPGIVSRQLEKVMVKHELPPETGWTVNGALEPGETVIQVRGSRYRDCRELMERLRLAVGEEKSESALSWQVEALVDGNPGDLTNLGRDLVHSLGGTTYSAADYNGSVHILAYVPWVSDHLVLEDGPVNLNLELYADPFSERVRLRAGIPVLFSLSHYPD